MRVQILHDGAVGLWLIETQCFRLLIGERQVKSISEIEQSVAIQFLLLVGRHLALPGLAHAKAFFGLRQNHGRSPLVFYRSIIGRINFDQVVSAPF